MNMKIFWLMWEERLDERIHNSFHGRHALYGVAYHKDGNRLYVQIELTPEEETYFVLKYGAVEAKEEIFTAYLTPYIPCPF